MTHTIIEARLALLKYFTQENAINPTDHHSMVEFECQDTTLKILILKNLLQELEKSDIVRNLSSDNAIWYVLVRPLSTFEQTVSLGYSTCLDVSELINTFFKSTNNLNQLADAGNITERDIQKLMFIIESLSTTKQ